MLWEALAGNFHEQSMLFAWLWATKSVLHRFTDNTAISSLAHSFASLMAAAGGVYQLLGAADKISQQCGPGLENWLYCLKRTSSRELGEAARGKGRERRKGKSGGAKEITSHQDIWARGPLIPPGPDLFGQPH